MTTATMKSATIVADSASAAISPTSGTAPREVGRRLGYRCGECGAGFLREADMLAPLTAARRTALSGVAAATTASGALRPGWATLYEVPAAYGIVDVLHVLPDRAAMTARQRACFGPVTDATELRVVLAAASRRDGVGVAELAAAAGISAGALRRRTLPRLLAAGQLIAVQGGYRTPGPYRIPVRSLVAIEAKRGAWREALRQASRYARFADAAYVALDSASLGSAPLAEDMFTHARVGLLAVGACGRGSCPLRREDSYSTAGVRMLRPSPVTSPVAWERALVAEAAFAMLADGVVSGPVSLVFGRDATATADDPRLAAR